MLNLKERLALEENIYVNTLSSGLKCYIIPKYGYKEKRGYIAVNFGAGDLAFKCASGAKKTLFPGTAHFLEHKMFEGKKNNFSDLFLRIGSESNAFTDLNKTVYYFSCTDNFNKNLELLFDMIKEPYFTDENVENEKPIIRQEITMYDDAPEWVSYLNLLRCMYFENGIKSGVAGTVSDIEHIKKEHLYYCYYSFYTPGNMSLICSGDFSKDEILERAEKYSYGIESQAARKLYKDEDDNVRKDYIEKDIGLKCPVFNLGFKHIPKPNGIFRAYAVKFLLDIIFGEGSEFFYNEYRKGTVESVISFQHLFGAGYALSVLSGASKKPNALSEKIFKELSRVKKYGISEEDFYRVKLKNTGRFLRGFNSIPAICESQADLSLYDTDLAYAFKFISNIKKEQLEELLLTFKPENASLSVVK